MLRFTNKDKSARILKNRITIPCLVIDRIDQKEEKYEQVRNNVHD